MQAVETAEQIGKGPAAMRQNDAQRGNRSSTPEKISEPTHSVVSNVYCAICTSANLEVRGGGMAWTG